MGLAAVPAYLGTDFTKLPPGHRFGTFFPIWEASSWQKSGDSAKREALQSVVEFKAFEPLVEALAARQSAQSRAAGDCVLSIPAVSVSPFLTGTGIEHPLEIGFAFLNPYGLPYLPGSGVKGVLRHTAELLAKGEFDGQAHGWTQDIITALFGYEPEQREDEASRGALVFWDVIIHPKDCRLGVDILTPHFSNYYFGDETPHESGAPNPVPFLIVPPGAEFQFTVQCLPALIENETLRSNWKTLMQSVFEHAFGWLGFGAKTAVGYGQLEIDRQALAKQEEAAAKLAKAVAKAGLSKAQQDIADLKEKWDSAKGDVKNNPNGILRELLKSTAVSAANWSPEDRAQLYALAKTMLTFWKADDKGKGKELLKSLK